MHRIEEKIHGLIFRGVYLGSKNKIKKCMGLLYKCRELVFQVLRYAVFIGICTHDSHFQIKNRVFTFWFKLVPQNPVFDLPDIKSTDISNIYVLRSHQFRNTNWKLFVKKTIRFNSSILRLKWQNSINQPFH